MTVSVSAVFIACLSGQPGLAEAAEPIEPPQTHRWGVEAELIQPFVPEVHIITVKATRTLWGDSGALRGDLMLGVYLRPEVSHDIVETINEYLLIVGYRQYFWRGLHGETSLLGGWAWGDTNRIDGQDYSNPVLLIDANIGYRFGFFEPGGFLSDRTGAVGFYFIPQFGFIAGLSTDIGPRGGKSDFFLQGKLLIGLSF